MYGHEASCGRDACAGRSYTNKTSARRLAIGHRPRVAKALKSKVAEANKLLVTLRRQLHLDDVANEVKHRVMLAAIKEELITATRTPRASRSVCAS